MSTEGITPEEWRKRYEAVADVVSGAAADLDELFDSQPEGYGVTDCLGLREDLRGIKDAMLRRVYAVTPEET